MRLTQQPDGQLAWPVVYREAWRWLAAACFGVIVHDLRASLRPALALQAPAGRILEVAFFDYWCRYIENQRSSARRSRNCRCLWQAASAARVGL